ncbi:OstA family protein [Calothrix sp. NIES-4071]|nr:OstA family protein [Calothrix sp. NIES-4071]BAZ61303.1 OstA family protein [Calothrix sp. NIES-4105]
MFEKHSLLINFAWLRRLHLSFLLPGVLIYVVLLNTTISSIYAQTPVTEAPTTGTVQTPVQTPVGVAPTTNLLVQPAAMLFDVITWSGDVEFRYEQQKITATAEKAEYYKSEQKVVLTGSVKIMQAGQSQEAETATFFVTNEFKMTADKVIMPNQ